MVKNSEKIWHDHGGASQRRIQNALKYLRWRVCVKIFAKLSTLDVLQGSEFVSASVKYARP